MKQEPAAEYDFREFHRRGELIFEIGLIAADG
jgi:hypothetical protein